MALARKIMHPKPAELALYGDRRRVVFVTGAAQGIGKAIALRLARDGLDVAVNDLKLQNLETVKEEVEQLGVRCFAVAGDVTIETRVEAMVEEVVKELGYLDVMVANAGISAPCSILDMSDEHMDRVLKINIRAVHLCYKFAAKHMIKQGTGGKLIAAASLASFRASSTLSAYAASKFAVRGYNQAAALEFAKYGITCNCYAPGFVHTDMTKHDPSDTNPAAVKANFILETVLQLVPLKRIAEVDDVSNLVSFLVSRNSDYITGQLIPIGGGIHML